MWEQVHTKIQALSTQGRNAPTSHSCFLLIYGDGYTSHICASACQFWRVKLNVQLRG